MHLQFTPSEMASFWSRVDTSGECWLWTGAKTELGYGLFLDNRRRLRAHRVAYALTYGEFPDELVVCHRCDNPRCVRPNHLFLGTQTDNLADMTAKGRRARGDTSGAHLHPERLARGDNHWSRQRPERRATGERHRSRTHPESLRRGDEHPARQRLDIIKRGERHVRAKLRDEEVREIRRTYAAGAVTQRELATRYGVSVQTVSLIVRGRRYPLEDR